MKKVFLLVAGFFLLDAGIVAQTVSQRLQKAFTAFEKDEQLKHAISSLYVIDARTGQVVFDKNSQVGLAPASTQKIIISVTAFELLGKEYTYKTELGYEGKVVKDSLDGFIFLRGHGDPTLGSWRFTSTRPEVIITDFSNHIKEEGIRRIRNEFFVDNRWFEANNIPDGWIWQDIGNYYGAGVWPLNWKENQFELSLQSGDEIGSYVSINKMNDSEIYGETFNNEVKAAKKGSGDNAYIYLPISNRAYSVRGTIPVSEKEFKISGAIGDAHHYFIDDFRSYLEKENILNKPGVLQFSIILKMASEGKVFYTHHSPSLDSIIYWFNKKSINLYGEALIKTFAYEKQGFGSTDSGVAIVKKFWKEKGLDEDELNIYDGSGLSPLNRVTTHAQVEILKYAKTKDWFPYFHKSLPDHNGMTMKSGTISDVKGFCGYHKAKDGKEYIFSFLVNNYSGKSSQLVGKMYKVLDELK